MEILFLAGIALMFCIPAFRNGFPLFTSDTGTYTVSGFGPEIPGDRPVFYGLFVRYFSMKESLWFVIFGQSLILAWLLSQIIKYFLPLYQNRIHRFFIFLFLTAFSSLPWFSSQIMADIFSPIASICIVLLLLANQSSSQKIFTGIILIFSLLTHNSHLLVSSLLVAGLGVMWVFQKYFQKKIISFKKYLLVFVLVNATWILAPLFNYLIDGKFRHTGSPQVFLMAKLAENGMLDDYLHRNCNSNNIISFNDTTAKFTIVARNSRKCIDVENFGLHDNARIQQWSYVYGPNQKYYIIPAGDSLYRIKSFHSGKLLTVSDSANKMLIQKTDSNKTEQLFRIIITNDNYVMFQNPKTNDVMEVSESSMQDGATIRLNLLNGQENQLFSILPENTTPLCLYQGKIPSSTIPFIWAENSIAFQTGGFDRGKEEYNRIIKEIVFGPGYFFWNIREAIVSTTRQLIHFDVGDGIFRYEESSSPSKAIKKYFSKDYNAYSNSQENNLGINFVPINASLFKAMLISLVIILLFFYKNENFHRHKNLWLIAIIFIFSLVINAFINGTMANVLDRLQSRMVWLIPLCAVLIIYEPVIKIIYRIKEKIF